MWPWGANEIWRWPLLETENALEFWKALSAADVATINNKPSHQRSLIAATSRYGILLVIFANGDLFTVEWDLFKLVGITLAAFIYLTLGLWYRAGLARTQSTLFKVVICETRRYVAWYLHCGKLSFRHLRRWKQRAIDLNGYYPRSLASLRTLFVLPGPLAGRHRLGIWLQVAARDAARCRNACV